MTSYSFKSLSSVTAVGAGSALTFDSPRAYEFGTLQVAITGSSTTVSVNLEGTLDGTTWQSLGSVNPLSNNIGSIPIPPVLGLRANLTTLTGGTSPTVSATIALAPTE